MCTNAAIINFTAPNIIKIAPNVRKNFSILTLTGGIEKDIMRVDGGTHPHLIIQRALLTR